jgi:hypothetical protein
MDSLEELIEKAEVWDDAAQSTLGMKYREGDGVPKDPKEGFKWLLRSAEHGYPPAAREVVEMYAKGEGVEKNLVKAGAWNSLNRQILDAYIRACGGFDLQKKDIDEEVESGIEMLRSLCREGEQRWHKINDEMEVEEFLKLEVAANEIYDIVSLALPPSVRLCFRRPKFHVLTEEEIDEENARIEAHMKRPV